MCWHYATAPYSGSLINRITRSVAAPFALIGLYMTFPYYLIGLSFRAMLWPFNSLMNFLNYFSPTGFVQINFSPRYPELLEDHTHLNSLKNLYLYPTRENFLELPTLQQYLVAARHTYPTLCGWYFQSRDGILNHFLQFELTENLAMAREGIAEAVQAQERIVFAKTLKAALLKGDPIGPLKRLSDSFYTQALKFIVDEYRFSGEGKYGQAALALEEKPVHPKTLLALDKMVTDLSKGYDPRFT